MEETLREFCTIFVSLCSSDDISNQVKHILVAGEFTLFGTDIYDGY